MGKNSSYQGCLLGLAVGDALGYSVDDKTWTEICETYGPNGLLGYDLQNDYADVSSYTQIAAYVANALLLGISHSPRESRMPFVTLGLKEWTRSQMYYRDPDRTFCWIAKLPAFRRRNCRDARMLDTLRLRAFGTPEKPANYQNSPGPLTEAVAIAMFYDSKRMTPPQVGELTAKAITLTHGSPECYLSGVVLAYALTGILQEPEMELADQFRQAIDAMKGQFPGEHADDLAEYLESVLQKAQESSVPVRLAIEQLECSSAQQCLAGAMYASLTCEGDFDTAIINAVNHSGSSAAVGALTGAILGAAHGIEALPDFYLESIEARRELCILANDMRCCTPAAGIFDDDWDQKYIQGLPL